MGYTSPLEDTKFVLENLLPAHEDLDDTTIDAVLSEAGKLADNYLAPLNHFGDKNNPILRQDHEVETPEGCLLYTSPSPRDVEESRMPSSA